MKFTNCADTGVAMLVGAHRAESDVLVRRREQGLRARVIGIVRRVVRRTTTENAVRGVSAIVDHTLGRRLKDERDVVIAGRVGGVLARDRRNATENATIPVHAIRPAVDLPMVAANRNHRESRRAAGCRRPPKGFHPPGGAGAVRTSENQPFRADDGPLSRWVRGSRMGGKRGLSRQRTSLKTEPGGDQMARQNQQSQMLRHGSTNQRLGRWTGRIPAVAVLLGVCFSVSIPASVTAAPPSGSQSAGQGQQQNLLRMIRELQQQVRQLQQQIQQMQQMMRHGRQDQSGPAGQSGAGFRGSFGNTQGARRMPPRLGNRGGQSTRGRSSSRGSGNRSSGRRRSGGRRRR